MNFLALQNEVHRLLQRQGADVSVSTDTFWTLTEIKDAINKAQVKFQESTEYLRGVTSGTSVSAATTKVAHPTDALEVRGYFWDGLELLPVPLSELSGITDWDTQTGTPYGYIPGIEGSEYVRLFPIPTASGTLKQYYVPSPTDLSGNTDTPQFPKRYHQALAYYAAFLCLVKSTDDAERAKGADFKSLYEQDIQRAKMESTADFSTAPRTIPYRNF